MPKKIPKEHDPMHYLENARSILRNTPIEDNIYIEKKPVREAFGTAYLAILEAINEALMKKGITRKELPKSVDGYIAALKKHLSVNNGKLIREFNSLYDSLHIAGYYHGLIVGTDTVKEEMKAAESFIKKLTGM
ncbi:DUF5618 family protein [Candidatus Magnetominusculus xianensis]|uniref:DUF5618 domain-containing protein n=1 Tax=Candidatus Magnetominusculus xianensis TaxID=1748249 RepID=A0ABR5SGX3_9BACT|nr:DUF5618 family protein [Candidatus Magnetominusculus xianensis]KWT82636.1 hypothetical protein ASN18_2428 [Candidatus Magnetominusculus xianensis]MBF0405285.1 DUF5618 family protein [Nitrospirota bacterium]